MKAREKKKSASPFSFRTLLDTVLKAFIVLNQSNFNKKCVAKMQKHFSTHLFYGQKNIFIDLCFSADNNTIVLSDTAM